MLANCPFFSCILYIVVGQYCKCGVNSNKWKYVNTNLEIHWFYHQILLHSIFCFSPHPAAGAAVEHWRSRLPPIRAALGELTMQKAARSGKLVSLLNGEAIAFSWQMWYLTLTPPDSVRMKPSIRFLVFGNGKQSVQTFVHIIHIKQFNCSQALGNE